MTAPEQAGLLPPEIESHPDLEFVCPHCGEELYVDLKEIYSARTRWTSATATPEQRRSHLLYYCERLSCVECGQPLDVTLEPVTTWRAHATVPDPLEKYTPNSRYWEAQKRGMATSPNLKLEPEGEA